jgi:hypothetical protein
MEGVRGSISISVNENTTNANVIMPDYVLMKPGVRVILQIENYSEGYYSISVLYSSDSNITAGDDYSLSLNQPITGKYLTVIIHPSILAPGVIIGLNDYEFSKGIYGELDEIQVGIPENTSWTNKVILLNLENVSDR